jgi:hypothetical protein
MMPLIPCHFTCVGYYRGCFSSSQARLSVTILYIVIGEGWCGTAAACVLYTATTVVAET